MTFPPKYVILEHLTGLEIPLIQYISKNYKIRIAVEVLYRNNEDCLSNEPSCHRVVGVVVNEFLYSIRKDETNNIWKILTMIIIRFWHLPFILKTILIYSMFSLFSEFVSENDVVSAEVLIFLNKGDRISAIRFWKNVELKELVSNWLQNNFFNPITSFLHFYKK